MGNRDPTTYWERRAALTEFVLTEFIRLVHETCASQAVNWQFQDFMYKYNDLVQKLNSEFKDGT